MLNLNSGELDLFFEAGPAGGTNVGTSWTTGSVIAWDCPTNEALEGADLSYKGADIPMVPLGLNVEAEMATSIEGGGPGKIYLGGSPLGFGGGQVGVQTGISVSIFRLRLLDL